MRFSYSVICVPFIAVLLAIAQSEIGSSFVTGHVFDGDGKPLAEARVIPFPLEVGLSGPIPFAITDAEGYYRLKTPAFGKTRICANKKGSGYPDTTAAIFLTGTENEPEVILASNVQLHDVDIHLPPPDGSVDLLVTGGSGGEIISNARITLRRNDDTSVTYATDLPNTGRFHVELPDRPIQITIKAPGYKPWTYEDKDTGKAFIEIKSHEHRKLTIILEPNS